MAKTAVALYDTMNEAQQVVDELTNTGFSRSSIRLLGDNDNNIVSTLTDAGLPHHDAEAYYEGIRRGGNLVMITTEDDRIDPVVDIMDRYNSINIQERAEMWRNEGWGVQEDRAETTGRQAAISSRQGRTSEIHDHDHEEATIPVVEEEMRVGKRQVEHGGVRVRTHVEEKPVEETVNLREEHVKVERRPVNRAAKQSDFDTFEEGTMEFSEIEEEAVVDKQARVVEEVVVSKEAREHQQKVRDKVRRTDVDVERVEGDDEVLNEDFATYRTGYRNHYNANYATSGLGYEAYEPAYQYGYTLRNRADLRGRSWTDVESQAHTTWERDHRGTWERFKDAIRHGWESVKS
jgi:uncharacterized protein (TIGR02271 family)